MSLPTVTIVVNNGQGRHSTVCEDRQRSDERRVGVDVGDIGVRPHRQFLKSLLHEGRHGHLTHLRHTDTHTHTHTHTQTDGLFCDNCSAECF